KVEELGVNLTVHTVGFGLPEAEAGNAETQLQCLASHTGGQFFLARDAQELRDALGTISETPPANQAEKQPATEPEKIEVTLQATDQEGGPAIEDNLIWTVRDGASEDILYESAQPEGVITVELTKGIKDIRSEEHTSELQSRFDLVCRL